MIPYHVTPMGGTRANTAEFLRSSKHALVSYARPEDLGCVLSYCRSMLADSGAYTAWRQKTTLDVDGYMEWVRSFMHHPTYAGAFISDVIGGSGTLKQREKANDDLLTLWRRSGLVGGIPVWHLDESIERLEDLCRNPDYPVVAFGSAGKKWSTPGTADWWDRMNGVMPRICVDGKPICKLHLLRGLNPDIFRHLPLSSADSSSVARNSGTEGRFKGYVPPTSAQRALVIAARIEAYNSAAIYTPYNVTDAFKFEMSDG